jgi:hypothetical protein
MRSAAYQAVIDSLTSDLPLTAIISLGGMGKSSLARAIAVACSEPQHTPHIALTVWISDNDRPGSTNLMPRC